MANQMKEALQSCSEIAADIMKKIDKKLKEEAIDFSHKNQSEIIVKEKTKKEILDLITTIEGLSKSQIKMILQFSESNGKLYIRQKFN